MLLCTYRERQGRESETNTIPPAQKRAMTAEKVNLGRRWVAKLLAGAAGTAARLKQLCVSIVCPI